MARFSLRIVVTRRVSVSTTHLQSAAHAHKLTHCQTDYRPKRIQGTLEENECWAQMPRNDCTIHSWFKKSAFKLHLQLIKIMFHNPEESGLSTHSNLLNIWTYFLRMSKGILQRYVVCYSSKELRRRHMGESCAYRFVQMKSWNSCNHTFFPDSRTAPLLSPSQKRGLFLCKD